MDSPLTAGHTGTSGNGVTSQSRASDATGSFTVNTVSGLSSSFDTEPTTPSPKQTNGFGSVNIGDALPLSGSGLGNTLVIHSDGGTRFTLNQGDSVRFCFTTTQPGSNVKTTLVWNDAPSGSGTTGPALINDLDLTVVAPNNAVWKGNADAPNAGSYDRLNNVEQVTVATPAAAGQWCIWVNATKATVRTPQKFSLITTAVAPGTITTESSQTFSCELTNNCYVPAKNDETGAIAGGVIGALVCVAIVIAAAVWWNKKYKNQQKSQGAPVASSSTGSYPGQHRPAAAIPMSAAPVSAAPAYATPAAHTTYLVQQQAPAFAVAPVASRPLPPGWVMATSDDGYPYYFNQHTGVSQWDPPQ